MVVFQIRALERLRCREEASRVDQRRHPLCLSANEADQHRGLRGDTRTGGPHSLATTFTMFY